MGNDAICVLFNGLLSFALALVVLLAAFRLFGNRIGMFLQLGILVIALGAVNMCNTFWWRFSVLQVHGVVPWLALVLFWGALVYFYAVHFETISRDGGPTFILFRFIGESPGGARTRQDILDYFCDQTVLSDRIEALVTAGWLERTKTGSHVITWRARFVLFFLDGWIRLLGYPWGG